MLTNDKMQDINTEGTYWEQPDIDIVTQLEITHKDNWKDWIHELIENTVELEKRIHVLDRRVYHRIYELIENTAKLEKRIKELEGE